ncbi:unnamed protein product [Soboliphyme baturini]|uniref:J domain-containing protein n=1 Tax=Soboliphyme baturini TaxID=241478 RepID=A0A183IGY0_9BILA|nr:unnamed protein product [Soboliphyme baturini]
MHRRFVVLLSVLVIVSWSSSATDPYETLTVSRSASSSEIKQAYKRLAKFWHPDRNKSPDAAQKFVEVNEAYELLSNPERRRRYDDFGADDGGSGVDHDHDHDFFHGFRYGGTFGPFQFQFHGQPSLFSKNAINLRSGASLTFCTCSDLFEFCLLR